MLLTWEMWFLSRKNSLAEKKECRFSLCRALSSFKEGKRLGPANADHDKEYKERNCEPMERDPIFSEARLNAEHYGAVFSNRFQQENSSRAPPDDEDRIRIHLIGVSIRLSDLNLEAQDRISSEKGKRNEERRQDDGGSAHCDLATRFCGE
jgi:hypothetical protein